MLAIWHQDYRDEAPAFSIASVRAMLASSDFSPIPGFTSEAKPLLQTALLEFVQEVEAES